MAVRLFYIDESYDADVFCLSAVSVRHTDWKECFDLIKLHRQGLKSTYGIPMRKEIHARDLVRGRGQLGPNDVGKWERSRIFHGILELVSRLPTVSLFNICLKKKGVRDAQMMAWDRMVNRIERTLKAFEQVESPKRRRFIDAMEKGNPSPPWRLTDSEMEEFRFRVELFRSRGVIIADEGRELEITGALRRMRVHNPIPSRYGQWSPGVSAKNITTDRIIEDPVFRESSRSYFLQLADCVAFALLKKEVPPTPNIKKYGIDKMFPVLEKVCYKRASKTDPLGIVRK